MQCSITVQELWGGRDGQIRQGVVDVKLTPSTEHCIIQGKAMVEHESSWKVTDKETCLGKLRKEGASPTLCNHELPWAERKKTPATSVTREGFL